MLNGKLDGHNPPGYGHAASKKNPGNSGSPPGTLLMVKLQAVNLHANLGFPSPPRFRRVFKVRPKLFKLFPNVFEKFGLVH